MTEKSPDIIVYAGNHVIIYGAKGAHYLQFESGSKSELINFPGNNIFHIKSNSEIFTLYRSGTVVTFQGSDGTFLKIPASKSTQVIQFGDDRTLALHILDNQVMLNDQIL